jgi:hypothetical protein
MQTAEVLPPCVQHRTIAAGKRDQGAACRQVLSDREANAAAAAGDEGSAIAERDGWHRIVVAAQENEA